jgi:hypothetical protein
VQGNKTGMFFLFLVTGEEEFWSTILHLSSFPKSSVHLFCGDLRLETLAQWQVLRFLLCLSYWREVTHENRSVFSELFQVVA